MERELEELKAKHELLEKKFEALLKILAKLTVTSEGCCHILSLEVMGATFMQTDSLANEVYKLEEIK